MIHFPSAVSEAEQLEREEHELVERHRQMNVAWRDRWPNHCKACRGWGAGPPPGFGAVEELQWDPCEALPLETCHRCGKDGLALGSGNGPCSECAWDFNDGEVMLPGL